VEGANVRFGAGSYSGRLIRIDLGGIAQIPQPFSYRENTLPVDLTHVSSAAIASREGMRLERLRAVFRQAENSTVGTPREIAGGRWQEGQSH
jgi:hypothetical protein